MHSIYLTIFKWSKFFNKFISPSIELIFSLLIEYKSICLIATVWAVSVSKALYTSPIAPFPINSPNCYIIII
jgi:hypothetical protein